MALSPSSENHIIDSPSNPFARGYYGFEIWRTVVISYDDRHPQTFLPLHPSQAHLANEQVAYRACIFNEEFALVTEGQIVPAELDALCFGSGSVQAVVHSIYGRALEDGLIHIGDSYLLETAQAIVRNLQFETGFYSRAWEISSAHLTQKGSNCLMEWADIDMPTDLLFIAFRMPYSPAIGVKLISTPWTDTHLQDVEGITSEELRQTFHDKGMPECLVNALSLAGRADVRLLIFDADAAVLDGLPLYDNWA